MRPISAADISRDLGEEYATYLRHFVQQRAQFRRTMASFGVPVSNDEDSPARVAALREQLVAAGARVRNGGKSIAYGSISPACARCRTGVKSVSEFLSLACHRSCWFCFNENQCDYHLYKNDKKDWRSELSAFNKSMGGLDYVALTGGEPLLLAEEACAFFTEARHDNPSAHLRLYTSGDQLTPALLEQLRAAGLNEIRFSIKLDDAPENQQRTWDNIRATVDVIPTVMVEMPVVPGTHDEMLHILRELERAGAFGINLLELCFPLHHEKAFKARGLKLKANPYKVLYDYGYAGALPIEGSEELALQLMLEEIERGTALNLHYCSLENKNTAQIYEQNGGGAREIPLYTFSQENFFYETLRCFGDRAFALADALEAAGCAHALDVEGRMVQFAPADLPAVLPLLEQGEGIASRNGGEGNGADDVAGSGDTAGTNSRNSAASADDVADADDTAGGSAGAGLGGDAGVKLFVAFGVIERDNTGAARFREVDALVVEPCDYQALYRICIELSPTKEDSESGFAGDSPNGASGIAKENTAKTRVAAQETGAGMKAQAVQADSTTKKEA